MKISTRELAMANDTSASDLIELATELTVAWLANPHTRVSAEEVPAFLGKVHAAVTALAAPSMPAEETAAAPEFTPAVTLRRSLASKDHIISMIDGKPYKALKRHLSTHGLTPQQYRERFNLKPDYPMVAENYAAMRRELAKKIGLGSKPGAKVAPAKPAAKAKVVRGAKKVAKATPMGTTTQS
jgi:predicted transcriptional regulator